MTTRYEPHICEGSPCKFSHLHSPPADLLEDGGALDVVGAGPAGREVMIKREALQAALQALDEALVRVHQLRYDIETVEEQLVQVRLRLA